MNAPISAFDPNAAWIAHMRRGDFAAAWKISDQVLASGANRPSAAVPRHIQAIWDGTPLHGKRVLVRCYHGLGDTIQFIRYMPRVKAIAKEVIVWTQPSLIPLLQTAAGIDQLLPLHEGVPEVEYDVDVEIMELPFIFRSTLQTIPSKIPYLHAAPTQIPRDHRLAVGLVWRGGDWDERRSIRFEQLRPLFEMESVAIHILQREPEQAGWSPGHGIFSVTNTTVEDAQLIRALDLMISVDTMAAHLAGAVGVPVWNLLQVNADWRWMEEREDSPWYPTMRLFRQTVADEWRDVIERVARSLAQRAAAAVES